MLKLGLGQGHCPSKQVRNCGCHFIGTLRPSQKPLASSKAGMGARPPGWVCQGVEGGPCGIEWTRTCYEQESSQVRVCVQGWRGGCCCLCSGTVCLSPRRLLPHMPAFHKVTRTVYSAPGLGASQGAAGTCLSSGVCECAWLPSGRRPRCPVRAHTDMGDHVGCHRTSLNPRISHNPGPSRCTLHGDKNGPSTAPGVIPWIKQPPSSRKV